MGADGQRGCSHLDNIGANLKTTCMLSSFQSYKYLEWTDLDGQMKGVLVCFILREYVYNYTHVRVPYITRHVPSKTK